MSATNADAYPLYDLTGFQRDLLVTIAGLDQASGQTIKDTLEKHYDKEINHGRLYPNLDTLVTKDLVDKGTLDRRTNYYDLSPRGGRELEAYRNWVGDGADE